MTTRDAMPADVRLARLEQRADTLDVVLAELSERVGELAGRVAWLERDNAAGAAALGADVVALARRLAVVERFRVEMVGDGYDDADAEHGGDGGT